MLHLDPKFNHWTSPKIFTFSWITVPCFSNKKWFLYGNIISFCTYRLCCLCLVHSGSHFSLFLLIFIFLVFTSVYHNNNNNNVTQHLKEKLKLHGLAPIFTSCGRFIFGSSYTTKQTSTHVLGVRFVPSDCFNIEYNFESHLRLRWQCTVPNTGLL